MSISHLENLIINQDRLTAQQTDLNSLPIFAKAPDYLRFDQRSYCIDHKASPEICQSYGSDQMQLRHFF
jgi:hypothetical protein